MFTVRAGYSDYIEVRSSIDKVRELQESLPMVARIVPWEYLRGDAPAELLAAVPALRHAKAVLPGLEYGVTAKLV